MKTAEGKPAETARQTFNLKAFREFWDLVREVALARNLNQPETLDKFALPALRKEAAKVRREKYAELGGEG
jgi:hypothetical protein